MSKRIVIVDDRPWKMKKCIRQLQKDNIVFYKSIYYPNNMLDRKRQAELMADYERSTGIEVVRVDSQNEFIEKMDELYRISDIVFFMDYDLKGDMNRDDFFSRVNVKYALEKDQENKKIWFYTSGPRDIKGLLKETFPENIINLPRFFDGQLYWDEEKVREVVEK